MGTSPRSIPLKSRGETVAVKRLSLGALLLIVVGQLLVLPTPSYADQWVPAATVPIGTDGIALVDGMQVGEVSYIAAGNVPLNEASPTILCSTFTSTGPCALGLPGTFGMVTALLPICTTAKMTNCVASMAIGKSAASMVSSKYVSTTSAPTTPGDPALGMPAGSGEELWTNPLANLGGSDTYATLIQTQFYLANGVVTSATMSANIYPYNQIAQVNMPPTAAVFGDGQVGVEGGSMSCAYTEATECGRLEDFPIGSQASLSIRVSNLIGGWFKGRLGSPEISETPFNATSNTISVSAGVVTVPTFSYTMTAAQILSDPALQTVLTSIGMLTPSTLSTLSTSGGFGYEPTDALASPSILDDFRSYVNNTAAGQVTVWNFGTLNPWSLANSSQQACLNDKNQVDGIVTTNSMVYQPGPPELSGQTFTYDVAGMHYRADGSVVQGTYDMDIRDSVAQCLYGFKNAPISASVSVTEDSNGDQNVATSAVSDNNGWLDVGASGFNFSDPSVSIELSQSTPSERTTITCVKGKVTKRITGVNPRCPLNYKKVT